MYLSILLKFLLFCIALSAYSCKDGSGTSTIAPPVYPIPICDTCSCSDNSTESDPYYDSQWHLMNTGQNDGTSGEDMNVSPAWDLNIKGDNVLISIIDDGLDYAHEDLKNNVIGYYNYNYLNGSRYINSGDHGTSVAGLAAASEKNGIGVRGVAPCASLVGYNLLQYSTLSNEYDAMVRNKNIVWISNNSWGPEDYTGQLLPSSSSWQDGIDEGITTGRNGLGIVYVWAGGNGGLYPRQEHGNGIIEYEEIDNSNYDGYANYYGVMAIGSVDKNGELSYYSERGANIWVCTHAGISSSEDGLATTDVTGPGGYVPSAFPNVLNENYVSGFSGTSAATPLCAGAVALILRANPDLTWRDVKLVLAETARKNDEDDSDWITNGAGYNINHKYGFGTVDVGAAVNAAIGWTNAGEFKNYTPPVSGSGFSIPDNNSAGDSSSITVSSSGLTSIESVNITVDITHSYSGDLKIEIVSPSGTTSVLAEQHNCYDISDINNLSSSQCSYFTSAASFTFGTVRHLGESADGTWELTVMDLESGDQGTLNSWSMKFYGR